MTRVNNFSAGPAMLPESVLRQVQDELLDWNQLGASVMEISHRSADFEAMAKNTETLLRELLAVPDNYRILFMHGGGRGQYCAVPLNILREKTQADFVITGLWSQIAAKEAEKYCSVNQVASAETLSFKSIPERDSWQLSSDAAYVHIVDNETVNGVEFPMIPDVGDVPLVADMSSNLLSRVIDVSKFGIIYACVQKNIGPAGLAIVIVRDDLIGNAKPITPSIFDYANMAASSSLYNTPNTFAWYVVDLVLQWIKERGGVAAIEKINEEKSNLLYSFIDESDYFYNDVDKRARSRMNVPFMLADESRNDAFLQSAKAHGLIGLKGHRAVGGMRASIYNAMPLAGVQKLIAFMQEFASS